MLMKEGMTCNIRDIGVLAAVISIVAMLVIPLPPLASKFPNYYKYYIGFISIYLRR